MHVVDRQICRLHTHPRKIFKDESILDHTLPEHSYPLVSHFGITEAVLAEKIVAKLPLSCCYLEDLLKWKLFLLLLKTKDKRSDMEQEAPVAQRQSCYIHQNFSLGP